MADTSSGLGALIGALFILIFLGGVFGGVFVDTVLGYGSETDVIDHVTKTERVVKDDKSYYLVYGENETYQVTDAWFKGRLNSSDVYGKILPDHTYKFHVMGKRVEFASHYRNIMDVTEV